MAPNSHRTAVNHLKRSDPVMARVIEQVGPCRFDVRTSGTHFHHIARAIVYQQLSTRAAATIHGRFVALYGVPAPHPRDVAATDDERLRSVGLSRQKAAYIKDLAHKVHTGALPLTAIGRLPDDQVVEALTTVKGIGVWSAQMFLMFRLGRPDVLPALDLGIQNAVRRAYGMRTRPTPRRVLRVGKPWSPYATIASWYLWRSLDGPAG